MHIPVLKKEVIKHLHVRPNRNYIDATAGQGGHIRAILEKNAPKGRVLGMEWDTQLYEQLKRSFQEQERVLLVNE